VSEDELSTAFTALGDPARFGCSTLVERRNSRRAGSGAHRPCAVPTVGRSGRLVYMVSVTDGTTRPRRSMMTRWLRGKRTA
jgi:hypothetical protein